MLESAEAKAASPDMEAVLAVEEVPPEVFEKGRIGAMAWFAVTWLVVISLLAIFAPLLPLIAPQHGDFLNANAGLFHAGHWFGTDETGRDVLSRTIWGARSSLLIGIGSVLFGVLVGGLLGLIAGFKGRTTDTVLSGIFNIFLAFPQLVLALALVSVLAPQVQSGGGSDDYWPRVGVVVLAVGLVSIPILGRITRASALSWSQREFVMAARAQGASDTRVMFREVLPNVLPAMLSIALLGVAVVIVLEGALAVFGLSIAEPNASWGNMIYSQLSDLSLSPAYWIVPSICIFLTALSFNYLGDVVRAKFDVRESAL